jgi:hypothetical protein
LSPGSIGEEARRREEAITRRVYYVAGLVSALIERDSSTAEYDHNETSIFNLKGLPRQERPPGDDDSRGGED